MRVVAVDAPLTVIPGGSPPATLNRSFGLSLTIVIVTDSMLVSLTSPIRLSPSAIATAAPAGM